MCVTKCAVELGRCIFFVLLCGCAYVIGCLEPALFPQRQTSIVHIKYICTRIIYVNVHVPMYVYKWGRDNDASGQATRIRNRAMHTTEASQAAGNLAHLLVRPVIIQTYVHTYYIPM